MKNQQHTRLRQKLKSLLLNERGDNHQPGVTWGQRVGLPECSYMRRWVFNFGRLGSIRVHHWTASDDQRHAHDHSWNFVTICLWGSYTDVSWDDNGLETRDRLHVGSVRWRPATHRHTVQVPAGGCWTLLLCTRPVRDWGFWVDGQWKRVRKYFKDHGHHPCT
jgi:hypothetical protein